MTNPPDPKDDGTVLAAEIALRLLTSQESDDALRRDPSIASKIPRWEESFVQFADQVPPVEPAPRAWQALRVAIAKSEALKVKPRKAARIRLIDSLLLWRSLAAVGFASAAIVAFVSFTRAPIVQPESVAPQPSAIFVTKLLPKEGWPAYVATYDPSRAKIILIPAVTQASSSLRPYLWLVPNDDEDPIRLGLADPNGITAIDVGAVDARLINANAGLVVTLEPNGASTDDGAQGEVLAHGVFSAF